MTAPASGLAVGISPPWGLWNESHEVQRRWMTGLADGGIDHLFVADHVSFKGGNGSDGLVHLAALSGLEPRLGLMAGVMLLALRHPVVAARQVRTLAEAAPGRLTLGVGVGGEDRNEFLACEVDPATRGRRTDAAVAIVARLLADEVVSWDDEFFTLDEVRVRGAGGRVPILIGGRSEAALARAAEHGEGWLAAWCSAERFGAGVRRVEELADPAQSRRHGLQLWVGVGDDPAEGRANAAQGLSSFYKMPFAPFERYTPCGRPADIAEFLVPYVEAGAQILNLTPVGPSREAEMEAIIEVAALLRAR